MINTNNCCPVCTLICSHKIFTAKDFNRHVSDSSFDYFICESCKTVFLDHVPENLADYYAGEYPAYDKPKASELEARAKKEHYKINLVMQYAVGNSLLEVGPSYGAFLYLASREGFQAKAIEMDPDCCSYITNNIGVEVYQALDVETCLAGLGKFDVITLWHVVEHLMSPVQILEKLFDHLSPGGILVIAAPSSASPEFRLFGRYWVHLDAPRHLHFIPLNALIKLCENLGLSVICSSTNGTNESVYNNFSWFKRSFVNFVGDFFSNKRVLRFAESLINVPSPLRLNNVPVRLLNIAIKLVYFVFFKTFVNLSRNGNAYTVVFRKN